MPFSALSVDPAPFLLLPAAGRVAGPRSPALPRLRRAKIAASVSTAAAEESSSAAARGRLESLSQVAGVLGTQWGDEGKGKLVDILAQRFDVVARCQDVLMLLLRVELMLDIPYIILRGRSFHCILFHQASLMRTHSV